MRSILSLLFLLFSVYGFPQIAEYVYRTPGDSTYNCYLTVKPETGILRGLVVRDYTSLPDLSKKSPYQWQELLLEKGLMVLYTCTTEDFPELFFTDNGPSLMDEMIEEVLVKYSIPRNNIFVGGISASGTRALRYTQYCLEGKSKFGHHVKAAFVVDSPLDMERFYLSATQNRDHFKDGMLWEAHHMKPYFEKHFNGTSKERPEQYRSASVYSWNSENGGNAKHFSRLPLLIYHEPDMDWWINERGAHYFDINSFDLAGFTNQLRLLGNNQVELITTTGKGFDREGNRKCHSWTIVDESYLANWLTGYIE